MVCIGHENKQEVWVKSSSPDLSDKKQEAHSSDLLHVFPTTYIWIYKLSVWVNESVNC